MQKSSRGFTLIELIMVIVILGILAAFALPRFADMGTQARVAAMQGVAASVKSAAAIAHAQYLADGSAPTSVDLDGVTVNLVNGYPVAVTDDTDGILAAAQVDSGDFALSAVDDAVTTGLTTDGGGQVLTIQATGYTSCVITYTSPTSSATMAIDTSAVTDTNCGG